MTFLCVYVSNSDVHSVYFWTPRADIYATKTCLRCLRPPASLRQPSTSSQTEVTAVSKAESSEQLVLYTTPTRLVHSKSIPRQMLLLLNEPHGQSICKWSSGICTELTASSSHRQPRISPTMSSATSPNTPVPIEIGKNGRNMSVTVVCGHPSAVTIKLAHIAPEAPVLGRICVALTWLPFEIADIIRGTSTRAANRCDVSAATVPAAPERQYASQSSVPIHTCKMKGEEVVAAQRFVHFAGARHLLVAQITPGKLT